MLVDGSEHFLAVTLPGKESAHYDAVLEFLRFYAERGHA